MKHTNDVIRMARQAGFVADVSEEPYAKLCHPMPTSTALFKMLERFFHMAQAAERNKLAQWMIDRSYATGHGDTVEDLLKELEWQVRESEREACAQVAERMLRFYTQAVTGVPQAIRARGQA